MISVESNFLPCKLTFFLHVKSLNIIIVTVFAFVLENVSMNLTDYIVHPMYYFTLRQFFDARIQVSLYTTDFLCPNYTCTDITHMH